MATGKVPKAGSDSRIRQLKHAVEDDPFNVNARFMLAAALEAVGRTADSVREFGVAVERGRRNLGVALCHYALALMKTNKPEPALRHFDMAIEADPGNASFYLSNKARAYDEIGLREKARSIYMQILDRKDTSKETQRIALKKIGILKKKK